MQFKLLGTTMPALEVTFDSVGESMYTQSGAMAWMTEGVAMESNMRGGLGKSLGRLFTGESLFLATYTAQRPNAEITFASTVPGDIVQVDISSSHGMICQKDAFLCSQEGVELKTVLTKKISSGFFGGEGFILQGLTGEGSAFLEIDGNKYERQLEAGEVLKVDTGNVVAFEESVGYEIEMVKGVKNVFFGGEGLFLTKLTGPGKVILQTQNFNDFAGRIISKLPKK